MSVLEPYHVIVIAASGDNWTELFIGLPTPLEISWDLVLVKESVLLLYIFCYHTSVMKIIFLIKLLLSCLSLHDISLI